MILILPTTSSLSLVPSFPLWCLYCSLYSAIKNKAGCCAAGHRTGLCTKKKKRKKTSTHAPFTPPHVLGLSGSGSYRPKPAESQDWCAYTPTHAHKHTPTHTHTDTRADILVALVNMSAVSAWLVWSCHPHKYSVPGVCRAKCVTQLSLCLHCRDTNTQTDQKCVCVYHVFKSLWGPDVLTRIKRLDSSRLVGTFEDEKKTKVKK